MKTILFFSVLNILLITSCGIKGDPLPPAEQETVQKAEPVGSKVNPATNSSQSENTKKKINENKN